MDSSDSESNLFVDHDFVTWKMVHAAKKVPEQVAWDPSFAKREFLLEYVLQASLQAPPWLAGTRRPLCCRPGSTGPEPRQRCRERHMGRGCSCQCRHPSCPKSGRRQAVCRHLSPSLFAQESARRGGCSCTHTGLQ